MYSGPRPTDEEFEALKMRRDEAVVEMMERSACELKDLISKRQGSS